MTKFDAQPLKTLATIYRFVGGLRSVSSVDLQSPVALVHDVGPDAARESSLLIEHSHTVVTAGTGASAFGTRDLFDLFDTFSGRMTALGFNRENTDIWYVGCQITITVASLANLVTCTIAGVRTSVGNVDAAGNTVNTTRAQLIAFGNGNSARETIAAGDRVVDFTDGAGVVHSQAALRAAPLPARFRFLQTQVLDDAVGAVTVTFKHLTAFTPRGSAPPVFF